MRKETKLENRSKKFVEIRVWVFVAAAAKQGDIKLISDETQEERHERKEKGKKKEASRQACWTQFTQIP